MGRTTKSDGFSFASALAFHYLCSHEDRMRLGIAANDWLTTLIKKKKE